MSKCQCLKYNSTTNVFARLLEHRKNDKKCTWCILNNNQFSIFPSNYTGSLLGRLQPAMHASPVSAARWKPSKNGYHYNTRKVPQHRISWKLDCRTMFCASPRAALCMLAIFIYHCVSFVSCMLRWARAQRHSFDTTGEEALHHDHAICFEVCGTARAGGRRRWYWGMLNQQFAGSSCLWDTTGERDGGTWTRTRIYIYIYLYAYCIYLSIYPV